MEGEESVTKEKLISILENVLQTDLDLSFLITLKKPELETLVACVRTKVDETLK